MTAPEPPPPPATDASPAGRPADHAPQVGAGLPADEGDAHGADVATGRPSVSGGTEPGMATGGFRAVAGSPVGYADERGTQPAPGSAYGTDPGTVTGGFPVVGVGPGTGHPGAHGEHGTRDVAAPESGPTAVAGPTVHQMAAHATDPTPASAGSPLVPGGTGPGSATGGFVAVGVGPVTGHGDDASSGAPTGSGPGLESGSGYGHGSVPTAFAGRAETAAVADAGIPVINPGFGTAPTAAVPVGPPAPVAAWSGRQAPASVPGAASLAGGQAGADELGPLLGTVLGALGEGARERGGPLPAGGPRVVDAAVRRALGGEAVPSRGVGAHEALAALTRVLAYGTTDPADPLCAGHLHCPPLAVAVAADLAASALNPSLDSWDQAPAATALETEVVAALAGLVGFTPGLAAGTVTTGGTESNLLGLLLARDRGGPGVGRHRVLCSDAAHFSVRRSAALLGMGDDAVVPVVTCADDRIDPSALDAVCRRVVAANDRPTVIVATAGTTDLGAVDPLAACADVAREHGVWLHVDAAYGGGALFSDRLAPLLHGIDRADSVGLDLHKLGWQPVAAGVFLVRDSALFAPLTQRAKYLNPADDEDAGLPSLLGHSPRTTRRADVFKIAVTLRALGRDGLGAMVDRCHALARYAGERIDRDPGPGALELTAEPVLTTVVFRYVPHPQPGESPARRADLVNAELRRRLLIEGRAVVGRTEVGTGPGSVRLKLTLLNPHASERDVDALLNAVLDAGRSVEREL